MATFGPIRQLYESRTMYSHRKLMHRLFLHIIWITAFGCAPGTGEAPDEVSAFLPVNSLAELQQAIKSAEGRPALLRVRADWDITDGDMDKTFSSACMQQLLAGIVLLEVDVTNNTDNARELMAKYQVFGPPSFLLFGEDGHHIADEDIAGYQTEKGMVESLQVAFNVRHELSNCDTWRSE